MDMGIRTKKLDVLFDHEQGSHFNKTKQVTVESHFTVDLKQCIAFYLFILCAFVNAHKCHCKGQRTTLESVCSLLPSQDPRGQTQLVRLGRKYLSG